MVGFLEQSGLKQDVFVSWRKQKRKMKVIMKYIMYIIKDLVFNIVNTFLEVILCTRVPFGKCTMYVPCFTGLDAGLPGGDLGLVVSASAAATSVLMLG